MAAVILTGLGILVFLLLVAVFMSMNTLETTELGLKYDWWEETVTDNNGFAYSAGRSFFLTGKFLKFPAVVQSIDFGSSSSKWKTTIAHRPSVRTRTKDGLAIEIECAMQYELLPKKVLPLYQAFGMNFEDFFEKVATSVIMTESTLYSSSEFFANRTVIAPLIGNTLMKKFNEDLFANVPLFQLNSVNLPKEFEDAIHETQMVTQQIAIVTGQRLRQEVEWQTELMKASQQLDVKLNQARAEATKIVLVAEAKGKRQMLHAEGDAAAMLVKQRATAQAVGLTKQAEADAVLAQRRTEAASIRLHSLTTFNARNLSYYLQARSYREVMKGVSGNETLFLKLMQVRALQNVSWKKMTVNAGPEMDPLAYMGLAPVAPSS